MNKKAWYREEVSRRFLSYAVIDTQSDHHAEGTPSTPGQWNLLNKLAEELRAMGITDLSLNEHGYIIARLPATNERLEQVPVIGFMAHVDTSGEVSGKDVKPQVIASYQGGDIPLGNSGLHLSAADNKELERYIGTTLITTDGSTLLGADDKAGAAEIMTALQFLADHPDIQHGPLEIIFTPDEETGTGMDLFPVNQLKAKFCYTLDGSKRGEIEAECFNAAKAAVRFHGVSYHLGLARGRMVNAVSMAASFISLLPQAENPEATDGRFGYYCPLEVRGNVEESELEIYLRDFETDEIERRFQALRTAAKAVEAMYVGGSIDIEETYQYSNMRNEVAKYPEVMENLKQAMKRLEIDPMEEPIRGGTDGARLTALAIPTPNIFTGGHNFHSKYEWASLETMGEAAMVVEELIRVWAETK